MTVAARKKKYFFIFFINTIKIFIIIHSAPERESFEADFLLSRTKKIFANDFAREREKGIRGMESGSDKMKINDAMLNIADEFKGEIPQH